MANNLAAFNSEAWSERLVTKLDQINVMLPLVNRNWEGDLRQNKTVHVRTAGNISMGSYTRGATISYQDLTPTNESFTVNDGEYFAFEVDDLDKAQSDVNAMDVYLKRAVVAMNNTVESEAPGGLSERWRAARGTDSGQRGDPHSGDQPAALSIARSRSRRPARVTPARRSIQFVGGNGNGATATVHRLWRGDRQRDRDGRRQ